MEVASGEVQRRRRTLLRKAWRSALTLGVAGFLPTDVLAAQDTHPVQDIQWTVSSAVDARTIEGVVVDQNTGDPMPSALVWIPEADIGVVAQIGGHFRLRVPEPGSYTVHFGRIGYVDRQVSIAVPPDQGVVASVGLRHAPGGRCGDVIYLPGAVLPPGPQVRVEVRDVLSGRAPTVPVTIRAVGMSSADSTVIAPVDADSLAAQLTLSLPYRQAGGPVTVSVASPAHITWTRWPVELDDGCPYGRTSILRVWLLRR